ncbi:DUF58 domain-containing protein [Halorientalis salina]|uniref:DUF58 domain-containing protein n=1 Tax=Halorientalis salina TaxID=2932266 RepID=UPI0010AC77A9|nr:DUF58 domain-containing protein [Halorientalis salina]
MTLRPTVRGVTVAVVGGGAIGMAYAAGPRALNAIAAPAVVALLAAGIQIVLSNVPEIERSPPPAGFPGERRTVTLDVSGSDVARVVDALPEGVRAFDGEMRATLPATVSYDVELGARGEWTLGPPTVAMTDVLGLFVRTRQVDATTSVLVYPRVYDLTNHEALAGLFTHGTTNDRQAFDSIREYAPGDPLRDVHWKSSAKRGDDELVVKQFVAEEATDEFHLVAGAEPGHADAMASGAASVALLALQAGLSVSVTCPAGRVQPGRGESHRQHVLELLARTGDGYVDEDARKRADVTVTAGDGGVVLTVDGQEHALDLWSTGGQATATDGGRPRTGTHAPATGATAGGADR